MVQTFKFDKFSEKSKSGPNLFFLAANSFHVNSENKISPPNTFQELNGQELIVTSAMAAVSVWTFEAFSRFDQTHTSKRPLPPLITRGLLGERRSQAESFWPLEGRRA